MIDLLTLRVVAADEPKRGTVYWPRENSAPQYECAACAVLWVDMEDGAKKLLKIAGVMEDTSWLDPGEGAHCAICYDELTFKTVLT